MVERKLRELCKALGGEFKERVNRLDFRIFTCLNIKKKISKIEVNRPLGNMLTIWYLGEEKPSFVMVEFPKYPQVSDLVIELPNKKPSVVELGIFSGSAGGFSSGISGFTAIIEREESGIHPRGESVRIVFA